MLERSAHLVVRIWYEPATGLRARMTSTTLSSTSEATAYYASLPELEVAIRTWLTTVSGGDTLPLA